MHWRRCGRRGRRGGRGGNRGGGRGKKNAASKKSAAEQAKLAAFLLNKYGPGGSSKLAATKAATTTDEQVGREGQ